MNDKKPEMDEEFKEICRTEFSYLLTEFGFQEDNPPPGQHENKFKIKFISQEIAIIVEGIHYGSAAMMTIEDTKGRRISLEQLNPNHQLLRRKRMKVQGSGQIEDIKREAKLLKQYGSELLRGNLSGFEHAIEKKKCCLERISKS